MPPWERSSGGLRAPDARAREVLMRFFLSVLLVGLTARAGSSQQASAPLLKTDLIELLASPVISNQEVADLVRRNCLAFRPTERDWADFRNLGASTAVVTSIGGCATARPRAQLPAAAAVVPLAPAVQVMVRQPRLVAAAGSQAHIVVLAARGGMPEQGVELALRGSATIDGAAGRDLAVATDDSGFAVFPLRVGRRLTTYRLEIAPAGGGTFPGRPVVELAVRAGPAASAAAEPREVVFDLGLDSIVPVAVLVRDSLGYPVSGESVVLRGAGEEMGFAPDTAVTDSLGRARFVVAGRGMRRGGTLEADVRGRPLASVAVVVGMALSPAGTGFLPVAIASGTVRSGLAEPVVFETRTRLGYPAAGRVVLFRGINADVAPPTATTDSAGRLRVQVTLGQQLGPAVVVATIDSLERRLVLQVKPGPAVELAWEHKGFRVDGRQLVVALDTTFVVRLRALDANGDATPVAHLAGMLWASRADFDAKLRVVRLLSVQEEPSAVALTFRSIGIGRADLKLNLGAFSAVVTLVVRPGPLAVAR